MLPLHKAHCSLHTGTTHVKKAHCSPSYRHYTHQESALQPLIPALHTSIKRTAASHTGTTHVKKAHCSLLIPALHTSRKRTAASQPALHTSRKRTAASHTGTTHPQPLIPALHTGMLPLKKAHCSLSYRHYTRQVKRIVRKLCATTTQSTAAFHTGTTHVKKAHCSPSYRHYTRQESALQPLIPALHTSRKRTAASHTGTTHIKKHCQVRTFSFFSNSSPQPTHASPCSFRARFAFVWTCCFRDQ